MARYACMFPMQVVLADTYSNMFLTNFVTSCYFILDKAALAADLIRWVKLDHALGSKHR